MASPCLRLHPQGKIAAATRCENERRCFLSNSSCASVEVRQGPRHKFFMRYLVGLLVCAALFFVVYHRLLKKMPPTDQGTASTQAITLIGVRSDLLRIAEAERAYIAINGHCAPLHEPMSSGSLAMTRSERDGYSYSVECFGGVVTRAAHHSPAPP